MPVEKSVIDALNVHMGREFEAHLQYLSVSSWFDGEGLPELTQVLRRTGGRGARARDEVPRLRPGRRRPGGHPGARRAQAELRERRGGRGRLPRVGGEHHRPHPRAGRPRDRPSTTTPTQVFLQWFVTEQVEEIATMGELLQVTKPRRARPTCCCSRTTWPAWRAPRPDPGGGVTVDAAALASRPLRGDDFRARAGDRRRLVRPSGRTGHAPPLLRPARAPRASGSRTTPGRRSGFLLGPGERGRARSGLRAHARRRPRLEGQGRRRASLRRLLRARARPRVPPGARPRRARARGLAPLPRAARLHRA